MWKSSKYNVFDVGTIKSNVDFLFKKKVIFANVESCLHVLSTDSEQLVETCNYVEKIMV